MRCIYLDLCGGVVGVDEGVVVGLCRGVVGLLRLVSGFGFFSFFGIKDVFVFCIKKVGFVF